MKVRLYKNPKAVCWLGWLEGNDGRALAFIGLDGKIVFKSETEQGKKEREDRESGALDTLLVGALRFPESIACDEFAESLPSRPPCERCKDADYDAMADAEALAALGMHLLSGTGAIPKELSSLQPALKWAVERMQYRHAWVFCSSMTGGEEGFTRAIEKKYLIPPATPREPKE
jgi:hypothetical protein